ncbi:Integral membrane protein SYS1-related [Klebsormidium nitens]|uniref:Integral membrane protein SYS1-related n=1 Tax=Klebsormidium nitens TaxID=105231 RepID=A0A1Y1HMJ7_KLENI|nr:Integral membrane protein SYS1-related [Klebsormidium nitens]|eukprot:GAQ79834.1 Integral membrane protein SYS1-related [Klebsormidium nitens]
MFYGAMVWDPWLILAQILVLQCLFYLSLGGLLWVFVGSHELAFSLHHFFDWRYMTVRTVKGWLTMLAFLCNAFVGAGFLLFLVERAKKCLDFSATLFLVHLLLCIAYAGVPASFAWWIVSGLSVVVMSVLGEWLCMRRELRDIPIRSRSQSGPGSTRTLPL